MRAILTYHSIDSSGSPISVDADAFSRHVEWLATGPVRVVALDALLDLPHDTDAVALTFDDGFENLQSVAAPLLGARKLPATVFVVSGHVGGTNAWGGTSQPGIPTLPLLDWDALGRLAEQGVSLGAHTHTHRRLPDLRSGEVEEEVQGCVEAIRRHTGSTPTTFAYPYGAVDRVAAAAVGRSFRLGCTTEHRALQSREDPARLPRVDMYYFRRESGLTGWGTAAFRRRLWTRRAARRLRGALSQAGIGR
jgi:peptidoglycan/xylan/chitin deacetylase (PgdA/CDA1 family)